MPRVDQLADYLRTQIAQGYTVSELRARLIQLGYSEELIGKAIDSLYRKKKKAPWLVVSLICIVLILAIGSAVWLMQGDDTPSEIPKVELPQPKTETELSPEVSDEQESADIFRSDIERRLAERRAEQEASQREEKQLITPDILPDQEPTIQDLEFEQIAALIREKPAHQGAAICNQRPPREKNECFKLLAVRHNSTVYCEQISDSGIRDNCYISFALSADFTACDKIVNKYLQLSCRTLGRTARYDENALLAEIVEQAAPEQPIEELLAPTEEEKTEEILARDVEVVFMQGTFDPVTIDLRVGVPYNLQFLSPDDVAGVSIPAFEIVKALPQGTTVTITITPETKGEYIFSCNKYCTPEYEDSQGTLIVQ